MKKIIIIAVIIAAVVIGFIPLITSNMADAAFAQPDNRSAQDSLRDAIVWKMRLFQFTAARRISEKAIIWFPESQHIDSYLYYAGRAAERDNAYSAAAYWYVRFLELFPSHPWAGAVRGRLEKANAKSASKQAT